MCCRLLVIFFALFMLCAMWRHRPASDSAALCINVLWASWIGFALFMLCGNGGLKIPALGSALATDNVLWF
jgi:hypothetical protein